MQNFRFNLDTDEFVGVGEAGPLFPKSGAKPPSRATLHRWASEGINGQKLPAIRIGRRVVTTRAAVRHFIECGTQGGEVVQ